MVAPTAGTTVNWPRDLHKLDLYINEERMYELLFSGQQTKARLQKTLLECDSPICLIPTYKQDGGRSSTCNPDHPIQVYGISDTKRCLSGPVTKMSRSDPLRYLLLIVMYLVQMIPVKITLL